MKKTVLALVAVVALSGSAFAANADASKKAQSPQCKATVDCTVTGSVDQTSTSTKDAVSRPGQKKLGIDVNPWIFPTTF